MLCPPTRRLPCRCRSGASASMRRRLEISRWCLASRLRKRLRAPRRRIRRLIRCEFISLRVLRVRERRFCLGSTKARCRAPIASGLETVLRLYAKGKFDTTYAFYVRTQTYRGAPHGDVTFPIEGEWTVLRGDAADPDATVYQLNPDDEQHSEALLVQDKGAALEATGSRSEADRNNDECDAEAGAVSLFGPSCSGRRDWGALPVKGEQQGSCAGANSMNSTRV